MLYFHRYSGESPLNLAQQKHTDSTELYVPLSKSVSDNPTDSTIPQQQHYTEYLEKRNNRYKCTRFDFFPPAVSFQTEDKYIPENTLTTRESNLFQLVVTLDSLKLDVNEVHDMYFSLCKFNTTLKKDTSFTEEYHLQIPSTRNANPQIIQGAKPVFVFKDLKYEDLKNSNLSLFFRLVRYGHLKEDEDSSSVIDPVRTPVAGGIIPFVKFEAIGKDMTDTQKFLNTITVSAEQETRTDIPNNARLPVQSTQSGSSASNPSASTLVSTNSRAKQAKSHNKLNFNPAASFNDMMEAALASPDQIPTNLDAAASAPNSSR